jgi:hypothetical protein
MTNTTNMITFNASADFGQTGQYVARITGRNSKFTFEREFIGRRYGKRNEGSQADVDEPGLYELRDSTRKGKVDRYRLVVEVDGELQAHKADKEEAMRLAKIIGEGGVSAMVARVRIIEKDSFEILGASEAKRAEVAQTVDTAIAQCWAILGALPEKEAKKVLSSLKLKVSPPRETPAIDAAEVSLIGGADA